MSFAPQLTAILLLLLVDERVVAIKLIGGWRRQHRHLRNAFEAIKLCVPYFSWFGHFLSCCCWWTMNETYCRGLGEGIGFLLRSEYFLNGNPVVAVWWDRGRLQVRALFWGLHLFDFISRLNWSLFLLLLQTLSPDWTIHFQDFKFFFVVAARVFKLN